MMYFFARLFPVLLLIGAACMYSFSIGERPAHKLGRQALLIVSQSEFPLRGQCEQQLKPLVSSSYKAELLTHYSVSSEESLYSLMTGNYGFQFADLRDKEKLPPAKLKLSYYFLFASLWDKGFRVKVINPPFNCEGIPFPLCFSSTVEADETPADLVVRFLREEESSCTALEELRDFSESAPKRLGAMVRLGDSANDTPLEEFPLVIMSPLFRGDFIALGSDVRPNYGAGKFNTEDVMSNLIFYIAPRERLPLSVRPRFDLFKGRVLRETLR